MTTIDALDNQAAAMAETGQSSDGADAFRSEELATAVASQLERLEDAGVSRGLIDAFRTSSLRATIACIG